MSNIAVEKLSDNEVKLVFPKGVKIGDKKISIEALYNGLSQYLVKAPESDSGAPAGGCIAHACIGN